GLDIFELVPSEYLTGNEIHAARTVHLDYLNAQGQPEFVWPPSFALARAYVDQLERAGAPAGPVADVRRSLNAAEDASGSTRSQILLDVAKEVEGHIGAAPAEMTAKISMLAETLRALAM
ncbi:MAG: hypothetical protein R3284_06230, partial [Rubricoccaceae bacterium]|nr:hypothetical protein [Rubricoccaceae bacterium]